MPKPSKAVIEWFRGVDPEKRVLWAARIFFLSVILGSYCTLFVANSAFEKILMAISWGAITITTIDIMVSTDVRAEQEDEKSS